MEALDTHLFIWVNSHHCTILDWTLWVSSQGWSWAIVLVLFLSFTTLRYEPRRLWVVLLGIACCFLLSDQISVHCFKEVVCRPRPCHTLNNVRMFHTSCGGQYGFVSSHAANVFALAVFMSFRLRKVASNLAQCPSCSLKPSSFSVLAFSWALVVSYSRPYLGKHYPGDVFCGALLGVIIGIAIFIAFQAIENKCAAK